MAGWMIWLWIIFLMFVGCESRKEPGQKEVKAPEGSRLAHPPPGVVARVNGKDIPASLLERVLPSMKEGAQVPELAVGSGQIVSPEEEMLERLINAELLGQRAEALGIQVSEQEIDEKLKAIKAQFGEAGFNEALKEEGLTEEQYRKEVERGLKISKLLDQEVYSKVSVSVEEIKDFYDSNPQRFNRPPQVKLRHIFIEAPQEAAPEKKHQAKAEIEKILERIKSGEPFAKVAREASQDPSASKGGDLGWVNKGSMIPEIEDVAFSMNQGEVSGIIESNLGYHIIRVEGKRDAFFFPLEKAKRGIENILTYRKREQGLRDFVEVLRKEAVIEKFLPGKKES